MPTAEFLNTLHQGISHARQSRFDLLRGDVACVAAKLIA
jgi:hypothetical protein